MSTDKRNHLDFVQNTGSDGNFLEKKDFASMFLLNHIKLCHLIL